MMVWRYAPLTSRAYEVTQSDDNVSDKANDGKIYGLSCFGRKSFRDGDVHWRHLTNQCNWVVNHITSCISSFAKYKLAILKYIEFALLYFAHQTRCLYFLVTWLWKIKFNYFAPTIIKRREDIYYSSDLMSMHWRTFTNCKLLWFVTSTWFAIIVCDVGFKIIIIFGISRKVHTRFFTNK